jgi:hypothetical protein
MAKQIALVNRRGVALVDDCDYEALSQYKWYMVGGYAVRVINKPDGGKTWLSMHRQIMDTPSGMDTDHINGDRLDNRRQNLRIATRSQNMANTKAHADNIKGLGHKGVSKAGKKWRARILHNGTNKHLGVFNTAEQAAEAYKQASLSLNGEFSNY